MSKRAPLFPETRTIARKPLAWFKPFANNPKTHPPDQVKAIRAAMSEFGWTMPILADESGEVIAGHGRLLAAALAPAFTDAPVIIAKGWTDAQKRAYRVADNKLSERGIWNQDMLRVELGALQAANFDLSVTGFTIPDLGALGVAGFSRDELNADAERAPPVPAKPVVKLGELWLLGRHRLVIGDCTKSADVAKAMGGGKPHLMVTDPPYGVSYDADWRTHARNADGKLLSTGSGRAKGAVVNDDKSDWREAWALFAGDAIYCWHAPQNANRVQTGFESLGFVLRTQIIWAKNHFAIGRGNYHVQHEPCFYMVRNGENGHWHGDRKQSTLWQIAKPQKSETGHSTQKPIECMRKPIANNSAAGDWVYDPFLGSGTTLIAAEMEDRRCIGIEINPAYAEVTIKRWQDFTKKIAKRDDGKTLADISKRKRK